MSNETRDNQLPYTSLSLLGYLNSGDFDRFACSELTHYGGLEIQQSFHLDDDLYEIAQSLRDHPAVDYNLVDEELRRDEREMIRRVWARFAMSSVWLEDYKVYLTVSRVIFYTSGRLDIPHMSFLRGQIHNADWQEQRNYTILWENEAITFPRIFDIPAPFVKGDIWYGPEDPRIIIEEGVRGAEPVIIFNMLSDLGVKAREMHAYRPFSGAFTVLTEEGKFTRGGNEKNWAPFFYRRDTQAVADGKTRRPDNHLYFLYNFLPFTILKCNLLSGRCEQVYQDEAPERHRDHPGRMSGGTQFVPISETASGTVSMLGFPRTHMNAGCTIYRPEMMLLTGVNGSFHVEYLSGPIDFKDLAMEGEARADPCGEGHIMIANSVARLQRDMDILTITFSVGDKTSQVIRVRGVMRHVRALKAKSALDLELHRGTQVEWATIGQDVIGCSVGAAETYAKELSLSTVFNGLDLPHDQQSRVKKLNELEQLAKFEEQVEREEKLVKQEQLQKEEQDRFEQEEKDRRKLQEELEKQLADEEKRAEEEKKKRKENDERKNKDEVDGDDEREPRMLGERERQKRSTGWENS